jgi:hypothetical protein
METVIKQYRNERDFNLSKGPFLSEGFEVSDVKVSTLTHSGSFPGGCGGSWSQESWSETLLTVVYTRSREAKKDFERKLDTNGRYRR